MKNDDNLISVFQFSRSKIANGNVSREKKIMMGVCGFCSKVDRRVTKSQGKE